MGPLKGVFAAPLAVYGEIVFKEYLIVLDDWVFGINLWRTKKWKSVR